MENLAREKMEELSLVEAEEKYLQKKYTKDLGREIYQKGYSYTVSSQTGTITKIRPDTVITSITVTSCISDIKIGKPFKAVNRKSEPR